MMEVINGARVLRRDARGVPSGIADARIWIIGRNPLQNSLLGTLIQEKTGLAFACIRTADLDTVSFGEHGVLLFDCFSMEYTHLWILLESMMLREGAPVYAALFNVDPEAAIERSAVSKGVRGVFYRDDTPEILVRGTDAILKGELWYSRKITTRLLMDNCPHPGPSGMAAAGVTFREKEILLSVASGASNGDIAEKFHISPHTVKNHVYNIFRKIKVKSRLEAILWVAEYL